MRWLWVSLGISSLSSEPGSKEFTCSFRRKLLRDLAEFIFYDFFVLLALLLFCRIKYCRLWLTKGFLSIYKFAYSFPAWEKLEIVL